MLIVEILALIIAMGSAATNTKYSRPNIIIEHYTLHYNCAVCKFIISFPSGNMMFPFLCFNIYSATIIFIIIIICSFGQLLRLKIVQQISTKTLLNLHYNIIQCMRTRAHILFYV